jgi:hypothetical protein
MFFTEFCTALQQSRFTIEKRIVKSPANRYAFAASREMIGLFAVNKI